MIIKLIKIIIVLLLICPKIIYSKDVLKANKGITWDSENQEYIATGSVSYESSEIKILTDFSKIFIISRLTNSIRFKFIH